MPTDGVERVETLVRELVRTPVAARDHPGYEDQLNLFYELVFEHGGLQHLGSVATLAGAAQLLRDNGVDRTYPESLHHLEQHQASISATHRQLGAVLDDRVSIEDLLYGMLDSWPPLTSSIGLRFEPEVALELQTIRLQIALPSERLRRFFQRYLAALEAGGIDAASDIRCSVDAALLAYEREERNGTVYALFAATQGERGRCCRVSVSIVPGLGEDLADNAVDEVMRMAAREALNIGFTLAQFPRSRYTVHWTIEEAALFEGGSIGFALAIGVMAQLHNRPIDCYTAFTGTVVFDGYHVGPVQHIAAKIRAARDAGMRRVFVPRANLADAQQALDVANEIEVVGVDSVDEAWTLLTRPAVATSLTSSSFEARVRHLDLEFAYAGLKVAAREERPNFLRLRITDYRTEAPVDIYRGKNGPKVVVGGSPTASLHAALRAVVETIVGPAPQAPVELRRQMFRVPVESERQRVRDALLSVGNHEEKQEANCLFRFDFTYQGERVIVRQFTSGTLTVQQTAVGPAEAPLFLDLCRRIEAMLGCVPGSGKESSTHTITEGQAVKPAPRGPTLDVAHLFQPPWIGTDEAGKGDYFGPLVSAAVYVDQISLSQLETVGIRDSKLLSDNRVKELASQIRRICAGHYSEVVIRPEAYNRLQEQFRREGKTLNTLLAWGHTRALENLLESGLPCENVIVDQFTDVQYIQKALLPTGRARKLNLVAVPRAEANIAVAAASILARDCFLRWIANASRECGQVLPKGAAEQVVEVARALVARRETNALRTLAKLHFKTTAKLDFGQLGQEDG